MLDRGRAACRAATPVPPLQHGRSWLGQSHVGNSQQAVPEPSPRQQATGLYTEWSCATSAMGASAHPVPAWACRGVNAAKHGAYLSKAPAAQKKYYLRSAPLKRRAPGDQHRITPNAYPTAPWPMVLGWGVSGDNLCATFMPRLCVYGLSLIHI